MKIPTDNALGYEKARAIDPEVAANYIAHLSIVDPPANDLMEELNDFDRSEPWRNSFAPGSTTMRQR